MPSLEEVSSDGLVERLKEVRKVQRRAKKR